MPLDHPGDQHPFHVTPGRGHGHEATRKAHGHDGGVDRETASVSAGWLKRERERERADVRWARGDGFLVSVWPSLGSLCERSYMLQFSAIPEMDRCRNCLGMTSVFSETEEKENRNPAIAFR